jgi:hypothetical protein
MFETLIGCISGSKYAMADQTADLNSWWWPVSPVIFNISDWRLWKKHKVI